MLWASAGIKNGLVALKKKSQIFGTTAGVCVWGGGYFFRLNVGKNTVHSTILKIQGDKNSMNSMTACVCVWERERALIIYIYIVWRRRQQVGVLIVWLDAASQQRLQRSQERVPCLLWQPPTSTFPRAAFLVLTGVAGFLPAAVEAGKSRLKQIINEDCRWCRRHHCDYGLCDIFRHALLVGFGQGVLFTACVGK